MSAEQRPIHSPLGASSAERWMSCPGSVTLIKSLGIKEHTDEPEYRELGVAAHEVAAYCLKNGIDAWEIIGEKFCDREVNQNMADAVQVYLDTVRPTMAAEGVKVYIEHGIAYANAGDRPEELIDPRADSTLRKYFYGTGDCCVTNDVWMEVTDYKHGEGIIVEAENNPQLMYYAFGFLLLHPNVIHVLIRIVQPRTFDEPVKEWWVTADHIRNWVADSLVPAMQLTEMDGAELDAGSWCRFCPAKLICPMMASLFGAAANANPKQVVECTDASLGRAYQYRGAVKAYLKALEDEIYRRLNIGGSVPGCKLVPKKANRVFKPEAPAIFKEKFGEEAFHPKELRSPAEMEKLGATAKELVREYAYTPQTGLTVATDDDRRVAVKVETSEQAFGAALQNLEKGN